jgi:predicted transcriptional regulator
MIENDAHMKTLSLKLPEELDIRIGAIARQRGSSKSEVVRRALEAYLAGEATPWSGSALELAGDLVGALVGPTDLSYHQEHMRGYGE